MLYKINKDVTMKGVYTEAMYDENPDVAVYSGEINKPFKEGDYFEAYHDETKNRFELMESSYGCSLHGSNAWFYDASELIAQGIVSEATERDISYLNARECYKEVKLELSEVESHIDFYNHMDSSEIKAGDIRNFHSELNKYVTLVLAVNKAKSNMICKQLAI